MTWFSQKCVAETREERRDVLKDCIIDGLDRFNSDVSDPAHYEVEPSGNIMVTWNPDPMTPGTRFKVVIVDV